MDKEYYRLQLRRVWLLGPNIQREAILREGLLSSPKELSVDTIEGGALVGIFQRPGWCERTRGGVVESVDSLI